MSGLLIFWVNALSPSIVPPRVASAVDEYGRATGRLIFDQGLGDARRRLDNGPAQAKAAAVADLLLQPVFRDRIVRAAGVEPSSAKVEVFGSSGEAQSFGRSDPDAATLEVVVGGRYPILSIAAAASSEATARRLVNETSRVLLRAVGPPAGGGSQLHRLGAVSTQRGTSKREWGRALQSGLLLALLVYFLLATVSRALEQAPQAMRTSQ